jgi:Ran GTPase-activating protein (RanGAP) involved in mRNA processing and transport
LTYLSLSTNDLTSIGVAELAESPFWGGLTTLDLSLNQIDAVGIQAVASSKSLIGLQSLRISDNRIGDAGIAVLVKSALFERMLLRYSRLDLRKNEIGPLGSALLADCPVLSRCTSLDLNDNEIGDKGLAAISASQHLQNLRVLKVGHNQISNKAIKVLFDGWPKNLGQLKSFDLSNNLLTSDGCMRILERAKKTGTVVDVTRNSQASSGTETPISAAELVQGVLQGVSEVEKTAELRRRVTHPNLRIGERPNPPG